MATRHNDPWSPWRASLGSRQAECLPLFLNNRYPLLCGGHQLENALKSKGVELNIRFITKSNQTGKDFHDRRVIFQTDANNPRRRISVLLTGGVDRYLNSDFECGVITHRAH